MTKYILKPEAQHDRDLFEKYVKDEGCSCFKRPPCGYCTHPGNPYNQEDDCFWVEAISNEEKWKRVMGVTK